MESFLEAKKARDEDFDDLMAACNFAKEAAKNGTAIEKSSDANDADDKPSVVEKPSDDKERQQLVSDFKAVTIESPQKPRIVKEPHALDNLQAELFNPESQTCVEKDENGFVFYKCRFCGLTFNYMNTLRAHERVHNVAQPYVCGKCGESFEFSCQLEYHTTQHGNVKGYKCECGRSFYSYTEMLYHKHPEDVQVEKEMRNSQALMVAPSTSALPVTLSDLPIPEFAEKGFEPKHPMKVYSDVRSKPYICEYCGKSYAESRLLASHMYSHRGEKTFNPRASRYMIGRQGIGYTDRSSYYLFPRTSGYIPPL